MERSRCGRAQCPHRPPRAPLPCAPRTPHRRAHRPCGLAVGRDVPIAPHRPVAVRPTRAPLPRPVRGPSPLPRQPAHSPRHHRGARLCIPRTPRRSPSPHSTLVSARRAPPSCPVAVGRDVPIAPPRYIARGGSPPRCAALHPAPAAALHRPWRLTAAVLGLASSTR